MSAFAQIALPLGLAGLIIIPLKGHSWIWWFIAIGACALFGVFSASFIAALECLVIYGRKSSKPN
jgi:hypothetical protein